MAAVCVWVRHEWMTREDAVRVAVEPPRQGAEPTVYDAVVSALPLLPCNNPAADSRPANEYVALSPAFAATETGSLAEMPFDTSLREIARAAGGDRGDLILLHQPRRTRAAEKRPVFLTLALVFFLLAWIAPGRLVLPLVGIVAFAMLRRRDLVNKIFSQ